MSSSRLLLQIPIPDAWDRLMATMPARAEAVRIEAERLAKLPNWPPTPRKSDTQLDADEDLNGDYR